MLFVAGLHEGLVVGSHELLVVNSSLIMHGQIIFDHGQMLLARIRHHRQRFLQSVVTGQMRRMQSRHVTSIDQVVEVMIKG